MMDYIKSRFSGNTVYWIILVIILPIPASLIFIFRILKTDNLNLKSILLLVLFSAIFLIVIQYLRHVKYLVIKGNKLKYYSIVHPFGKTLYIEDFVGKITLTESGSAGTYNVVYLINKQNKTSFKLMGLHYKNFDEINNAIKLKKINFSPTVSQYFKLLFFEKITIKNEPSSNNEVINVILSIFKLITIIGIILFIVGSIIKKFT